MTFWTVVWNEPSENDLYMTPIAVDIDEDSMGKPLRLKGKHGDYKFNSLALFEKRNEAIAYRQGVKEWKVVKVKLLISVA